MIKVLFFGPVADRVKLRETEIAFGAGMTLNDVLKQLDAKYPALLDAVSFIAVNQAQVDDRQAVLSDNDEIALMAKFSGG